MPLHNPILANHALTVARFGAMIDVTTADYPALIAAREAGDADAAVVELDRSQWSPILSTELLV